MKRSIIVLLFLLLYVVGCSVEDPIQHEQLEKSQEEVEIQLEEAINDNEAEEDNEHIIQKQNLLPEGFVYLDEYVPYAQFDLRYYTENNFVGKQVEGYYAPYAIGTINMAEALEAVSEELYEQGYTLLIYDAYRPAKAVSFFKEWAKNEDITMKEQYYPNENKSELFKRGYLASRSGHSRGSTVDLTLIYNDTNELVDMGSEYDMLDEISGFNTKSITPQQANNRDLLRKVMVKHGFKEYSKEWWHYVLKEEPYPDTYFDFDVQ